MPSAVNGVLDVAVVGAGFSGIGAAIALRRSGFERFAVLEAGDGVGGAWHWNTYPGIGVDIPSFSYQFSYEQRPWSRVYAPGRELKQYAEDCVDKYGLRSRIRLNTNVVASTWDEDAHAWHLRTEQGETVTARHVIGATGVFSRPVTPDIPGIEDFAGVTIHTARWDHDVDLRGKRVALIGTGASAVQVVPTIAPEVEQLTVFQRTPIWCLPKFDGPLPGALRAVLRYVPGAKWALRALSQTYVELTFPLAAHYSTILPVVKATEPLALQHLQRQVHDPVVRDKLTPRYGLGCKRPGFSNDYLRTFNRDNVDLITDPIERITSTGIRTGDGQERTADVLVLATGFRMASDPENYRRTPVRGRNGFDLATHYAENRLKSYEGVTMPELPNHFMIFGPYGWTGASWHVLVETAARHITRVIRECRERGATEVEVTQEATDRFYALVEKRMSRSLWFSSNCATANSYYFDHHGDVPFLRPTSGRQAHRASRSFPLDDYRYATADGVV